MKQATKLKLSFLLMKMSPNTPSPCPWEYHSPENELGSIAFSMTVYAYAHQYPTSFFQTGCRANSHVLF